MDDKVISLLKDFSYKCLTNFGYMLVAMAGENQFTFGYYHSLSEVIEEFIKLGDCPKKVSLFCGDTHEVVMQRKGELFDKEYEVFMDKMSANKKLSETCGLEVVNFCDNENFIKLFNLNLSNNKVYETIADISSQSVDFPSFYDVVSFIEALNGFIENYLFDKDTDYYKEQANNIIKDIHNAFKG